MKFEFKRFHPLENALSLIKRFMEYLTSLNLHLRK